MTVDSFSKGWPPWLWALTPRPWRAKPRKRTCLRHGFDRLRLIIKAVLKGKEIRSGILSFSRARPFPSLPQTRHFLSLVPSARPLQRITNIWSGTWNQVRKWFSGSRLTLEFYSEVSQPQESVSLRKEMCFFSIIILWTAFMISIGPENY